MFLSSSPPSLLSAGGSRTSLGTDEHGSRTVAFETRRTQRERCSSPVLARAVENTDSQSQQKYEVDQAKAREALSKLDQQLESLSKKQVPSPKIKASDIKWAWDRMEPEEAATEFSGSFLPLLTVALVVFTIFYNVLFVTVIKPSIDGPDYAPETPLVRSEEGPSDEATGFSSPISSTASNSL